MPNDNLPTIFFIRHGETLSNFKRIRQGVQIDDYLDTLGILQTEKIIPLIKALNLDVLYTSYLHRAEETVALINNALEKPIEVRHDFRLHERDFGSLTGKPPEEWDKILPNHKNLELIQAYNYRAFGGENVQDVRERAFTCLNDIIENNHNKNVGIITHNGIIRLLLFHFPEIPRIYRDKETLKDIANTDIYEWDISDGKLANLKSLIK